MKTIRLVTSSSLIALGLASACTSSDDIWFPPGSEGGKADSYTTIKGSDIPSQYVNNSLSYMLSRRIDSLKTVGALDMVETRLADRIDGIIANMPADGRLHLAELVRMEDPAIFASLFSDEKAALPTLWTKVEAPSTNDLVVGPGISLGVVDTATPPGPAVPPASLTISTLDAGLQTAATRLQNVYNADANTATVQIADLDNGIANPGAFTQQEVTAFSTIKAVFREQAVATADGTLEVSPAPGPYSHSVMLGTIGFSFTGETRIEEERIHQSTQMTLRMTAVRVQSATATLPQNHLVLLIGKDTTGESVFGSGPTPAISEGSYVVEVWNAGQRTFATNAVLPSTNRDQRIDVTDKLDYTLRSAISPLVRNTVSATRTSSTYTAKFSYDKTAIQPMGTPDPTALQRTATPTVKIPVGRYSLPQAQLTLYVYPNNVMWLQRSQQMFRMLPMGNGGVPTRFLNTQLNATFDATTNQMTMSSFSVVLTASMRDI